MKSIEVLHQLLPRLSDERFLAIYFRFWESLTIQEVAKILGRSWSYTDQLIEQSIAELRSGFLQTDAGTELSAA